MNKTYHARVFGGKEAVWKGVDQGKHPLYLNALNMAMNAIFDDNVFKVRVGQEKTTDHFDGAITTARNTGINVVVGSGKDIYLLNGVSDIPAPVPARLLDSQGNLLFDSEGKGLYVREK